MSILLSNNNIVLTDKCSSLQNLTVRLVVTEDVVAVGNTGFSLQLNTYPSPGQTSQGQQLNWFQYVIAIQNNSASGVAQYWSLGAPSSWPPGYNYRTGTTPWLPVIPGDPVWKTFGSVPFNQLPAESVMEIALATDSNNVTSATFSITDPSGKVSSLPYPLPTYGLYSICAFQINLVGPPGSACTFSSGAGDLTYSVSSGSLADQGGGVGAACGEYPGAVTGETSNAVYGPLNPSTGSTVGQTLTISFLPFTISGNVTDASGSAIQGATVAFYQSGIKTTTNLSENYSISMQPASADSNYTLIASDPGYTSSSVTLSILSGATITQNFVLTRLGSLTGLIIDANKTPITGIHGATVSVGSLKAVSDPSGSYTLGGLNPGINSVTVSAPGFDTAAFSVPVVSGAVTTQNFSLMEASGILAGTVVEQDTGQALDATISIWTIATVVATDGVYRISGIPAGQWHVSVRAPLHVTQTTMVQFSPHQTVRMDFVLLSTRPPRPPV